MKSRLIYYHILTFTLAITLSLPALAKAQITDPTDTENGLRGAPIVYKYAARAAAMANATVGDIQNLMAINVNPAALAFVQNMRSVQLNIYQNWNNNLMLENFAFPIFANSKHAFAGQIGLHHGGIKSTNFLGTNPMPQPSVTMYQLDLAYAITVQDVLSFGILNNISFAQNNNNAQYWTSHFTLGVVYSPSLSVSYGMAFRGLGRSLVYRFVGDGRTAFASQDLREVLELGATMRFPVDTQDPYFSLSLANAKRFGEAGIWYKGGFEVKTLPFLLLRAGLLYQSDTDVTAPRFGIGIVGDVVELDYALSYDRELYERFHQLTLTLHLGR